MINSLQLDEIAQYGKLRSPSEAVGVILKGVVIELPNRSNCSNTSFELRMDDLAVHLEVTKMKVEDDDWLDMTIWHTHPGGTIGPSTVDMRNRIKALKHLVVAMTSDGPVPSFY